jgi:hypothetical protein
MRSSRETGMTCEELAGVLEQHGFAPLPDAVGEHLAICPGCQGLVADFAAITAVAHELPAEVLPPAHIWTSLRSQLVTEGLIREASAVELPQRVLAPASTHSWWHGFSGLFQGRALATAAVGLLIMAAGIAQLRQPVVSQSSAQPHVPVAAVVEPRAPYLPKQASALDPLAASGAALTEQEHVLRSVQPAGTLASSPVDDSLQEDLRTLNAFIVECEHHLQTDPNDQLAREYLAGAYQQKAELLSEMLDRGRSVN